MCPGLHGAGLFDFQSRDAAAKFKRLRRSPNFQIG